MDVQSKVLSVMFYGFFYRIGKLDFYGTSPKNTIVGNEMNKDWLIWLLSLTEKAYRRRRFM